LEGMRTLRKEVDVPIAADELVRQLPDPLQIIEEEAADVVVVKVQPLGGVRRALDVAERVAVPVVVSYALEASVGIAAGVAAADVVGTPLLPRGGEVGVTRPEPLPAALEAHRPPQPVVDAMLARVQAAGELLT